MNKNKAGIGQYYLGIDIGGTNIRFGIVDVRGRLLSSNSLSVEQSADKAIGQIKTFIKRLIKQSEGYKTENTDIKNISIKNIKAIGIAAAGQIDKKNGVILYSPNLNWRNVRIKDELENSFNIPVSIENDVNAIAYGEWKIGAGKGVKNLVCIFIGTGIGSGLVINNRLSTGCNGSAGEIGHTVIVSGGRKCHCGNNGCFEAYAGGWGIAEMAVEKAIRNPEKYKTLIELSSGGMDNISSESISKAYMLQDGAAKELVHITAEYIADGIISIVNLLNPCMIILGGGVIDGIPDLVEIAEKEIRKRALKVSLDSLKIIKSEFGESAGLIGAAMVAKSQIKK
jgi:glucokinase